MANDNEDAQVDLMSLVRSRRAHVSESWDDESGVFALEEGSMSDLESKLPWARDPELAGSAV